MNVGGQNCKDVEFSQWVGEIKGRELPNQGTLKNGPSTYKRGRAEGKCGIRGWGTEPGSGIKSNRIVQGT